jgi:hypothetical protein
MTCVPPFVVQESSGLKMIINSASSNNTRRAGESLIDLAKKAEAKPKQING